MPKNIYISSYQGDVLLTDFPDNYKREYAKNVAYHLLNEKHMEAHGQVISGLSNVIYTVNPYIVDTYEDMIEYKLSGIDCVDKSDITVIASYDEILEWRKWKGKILMEKLTMLEVKNSYTDQLYYVEKLELNNDIISLYTFNNQRLLHSKFIGKATLEADYQPVAIMEIEL